ncbi:MAG: prepilin-type N-terminal cleavage/methylation domain-containing protein [Verrucomicrobiia bacterium]
MKVSPKSGFTLIELLVVITIIGILIGIAVPTIGSALDRANQMKDLSNIKQVGTLLFVNANDNNGQFFKRGSTTSEMFQELWKDGGISSAAVLGGTGLSPIENPDTSIPAEQIAWQYIKGLKTSSNANMSLLISYGPLTDVEGLTKKEGVNVSSFTAENSLWGDKVILAYYVGGNASRLTPKDTTVQFTQSDIAVDTSKVQLLTR